jgi:predicted helicase
MAEQARAVRADLLSGSAGGLNRLAKSVASTVGREVLPAEAADVVAQAAACTAPILVGAGNGEDTVSRLNEQLAGWEREAIQWAQRLSTDYSVFATARIHEIGPAHLFEHFLHRYTPQGRKRGGVFFTPQPIADFIVRRAACLLREEFSLVDGLADESVTILDPACGTGVFLLSVIDHLKDSGRIAKVASRLIGVEILPAAAFLAKLNVALKLAEAGCNFEQIVRIHIVTGDALSPKLQSEIRNRKSAIPVVIGNPPFSSLSTMTNDWISRLVRGNDEVRGYVRANGQRLEERKTWLHDDYVKFIRLAQWHVEQGGCGIVGFITNHGYLDNATFRLMRQELLRVFPRTEIVDLHGNRKKHELAPGGGRDENVFGLDQGVAISLLSKVTGKSGQLSGSSVRYAELWGSREQKLAAIANAVDGSATVYRRNRPSSLALRARILQPRSPDWVFVPRLARARHSNYDAAWSLAKAMPVNATAPVTARDHFVVAFTAEELCARIEEFRDLSVSDQEIRWRYFQRTRSARYEVGDTRGWKMAEARRIIVADRDWSKKIARCLYRPFDWRYVFWHPAMIDWPRHEVTRHLNPSAANAHEPAAPHCLIARRQQLPTQPCTFFWISDGLALDGVIRSDNRGSESLFPLYLIDEDDNRSANFAPSFIEQIVAKVNLSWLPLGSGDLVKSFGPEDLFAYIYAQFHSPSYREKYADNLRRDFPRVLAPSSVRVFAQLSVLGKELIDLHSLKCKPSVLSNHGKASQPAPLSAATSDQSVANFRAGGYIALRKWLQPRHRMAADPQYGQIVNAIARTIEIMDSIDMAVKRSGGCKRAFGRRSD